MEESKLKEVILATLKPYTSQNPLKRKKLLTILQTHNSELTDSAMRTIILHMVLDDRALIGSTHRGDCGYFIIRNESDLSIALNEIEEKAKKLFVRKTALTFNYNIQKSGQTSFC